MIFWIRCAGLVVMDGAFLILGAALAFMFAFALWSAIRRS